MAGLDLRGPLALDANCLSYVLLRFDPDRQQKMMLALSEARDFGLNTSAVALAEVLVEPARTGSTVGFEAAYSQSSTPEFLAVTVMDHIVARTAALIRGASRLKLPDAIVVASAIHAQADVLLSNDREVVRVASEYLRAVYFDDWQP